MRVLLIYLISWVITSLAAPSLHGQSSGLDFLTIGSNSYALSLNDATTAVPNGGSSLFSNPANLVLDSSSSITGSHTLWIADLQNSHLAINLNNDRRAIAFGLFSSRSTDFEARTRPGPSDGSFTVSYLSLAGGYSIRIRNFGIGLTGQFLREEFFVNTASGFAFNGGVTGEWFQQRLRVGAVLLNLGEMDELAIDATPLPTRLKVGGYGRVFRFTTPRNPDLPIEVSLQADYVQPLEDQPDNSFTNETADNGFFNLGLAFDIAETITLSGGYKTGDTTRHTSFGAGITVDAFRFTYAVVPFTTGFGTAHSISLQYYY